MISLVLSLILAAAPATDFDSLSATLDSLQSCGQYAAALELAKDGVEKAREVGDEESEISMISWLGAIYQRVGDFERSLECHFKVYEYDRETDFRDGIAADLGNIATVYLMADQPQMAEKYILSAINYAKEDNARSSLAIRMGTASEIYTNLHEYDKAIDYATEAYEIDKADGRDMKASVRLCQLAAAQAASGTPENIAAAEENLRTCIADFKKSDQNNSLAIAYRQMAGIYEARGQAARAAEQLRLAADLCKEGGNSTLLLKVSRKLADILSDIDPKAAIEWFELSSRLDSEQHAQNMENVVALYDVEFRTREKEQIIELQQERLRYSNTVLMSVIAFLIAAAAVAIILGLQKRKITKLNSELEDLNAVKDKFFSIISHDLRAPAVAQKTALQMLVANYDKLSTEQQKNFCAGMLQQAEGQVDLLENLLKWARMQVGAGDPVLRVRFNLANALQKAIAPARGQCEQKELTLALDCPQGCFCVSDQNMLSTIVRNLVSNAVKFTPRGGTITVSARQEGSETLVSVADSGVGMDAEKLSKLFKLDQRVSSAGTENEPGSGLGLILTHSMAERLGGRLDVTSELGHGTTFTLCIPSNEQD